MILHKKFVKRYVFFEYLYHSLFEDSILSVARATPNSQVRAAAILLLLIAGTYTLRGWGYFKWRKV